MMARWRAPWWHEEEKRSLWFSWWWPWWRDGWFLPPWQGEVMFGFVIMGGRWRSGDGLEIERDLERKRAVIWRSVLMRGMGARVYRERCLGTIERINRYLKRSMRSNHKDSFAKEMKASFSSIIAELNNISSIEDSGGTSVSLHYTSRCMVSMTLS